MKFLICFLLIFWGLLSSLILADPIPEIEASKSEIELVVSESLSLTYFLSVDGESKALWTDQVLSNDKEFSLFCSFVVKKLGDELFFSREFSADNEDVFISEGIYGVTIGKFMTLKAVDTHKKLRRSELLDLFTSEDKRVRISVVCMPPKPEVNVLISPKKFSLKAQSKNR